MESRQNIPKTVVGWSRKGNIRYEGQGGDVGERADSDGDDYAKGAATATSQSPKEISVLILICNKEFSLFHRQRLSKARHKHVLTSAVTASN